MDFKLIGGILLIVGTSIGAGMLALPVATHQFGFIGASLLLLLCWSIMTYGALLILEVNLWLPENSNLISMAELTLGKKGAVVAWLCYLLLLYSLLAAYIAGGSELFFGLFQHNVDFLNPHNAAILFTLFFGLIVYGGIKAVDYAMRGLMVVKLTSYFLLVILLLKFIHPDQLGIIAWQHQGLTAALMVTLTSFGYAAIVPSLRVYFASDIYKLKQAILIGSLIPMLCYLAWNAAIIGILPLSGIYSLVKIAAVPNTTAALVAALIANTHQANVVLASQIFTSICVLTSFLGVGLCLVDFFADGLRLQKQGWRKIFLQIITFMPPLLIVLVNPDIFVSALKYAGFYCVTLLVILPALMAWSGRYKMKFLGNYTVPGGKFMLVVLVAISFLCMMSSIII